MVEELNYRRQSFDDRLREEYDLWVALLGKEKANEHMRKAKPAHDAMRKLWKLKGIQNRGQYEDWELEHKEERNEFLKKEGVWEIWLNN